ncbi:DUF924 family protein [Thaumasiovibrio subtropicus]|uniref:DUF924 family protein n=1 Tax=Thaumasiovibrio subtropicus TaxID=1891207 RepID=UPI000B3631B3|nr:DUF924 family protein [Thaumasiovibrio subtropicus]
MQSEYQPVLDFWFGELDGEVTRTNRNGLWFEGSDANDDTIRERFQHLIGEASLGNLCHWCQDPRGTLALIILLDQFSRNIYRGLGAAFRHDAYALAVCKKGLASNQDDQLTPIERVFFYLPLEHSENIDDQEESLFRFDQLRKSVQIANQQLFEGFYQYARRHHAVINDFGRFPHRNAACGRLSTRDELSWLNGTGERFGQ